MTDEEFLQLKPAEARQHAWLKDGGEKARLHALYLQRHSVALAEHPPLVDAVASDNGSAVFGWVMVLAGGALMIWAFFFDVGRDVPGMYDRVANADAMALRSMILITGAASFVSGWVLVAVGQVVQAIGRASKKA